MDWQVLDLINLILILAVDPTSEKCTASLES